jgi:hypothetical protein
MTLAVLKKRRKIALSAEKNIDQYQQSNASTVINDS